MKFEIDNGNYVGTAEWQGPGRVRLEVENPDDRRFFERYFAAEDSYMAGPVGSPQMTHDRRDASERAFEHAAFCLAAYAYRVRPDDRSRNGAHH